jgi:hypothetical protein
VAPDNAAEPVSRDFARNLVKGPTQLQAETKVAEPKKAASGDEDKGAFDQIKQDIDSIGKALNPFRW